MADAIYILLTILFFVLAAWYVHGCDKLPYRTNGLTVDSCRGSRRRYRGVTDGSGTRLHSGQVRRPPRPGAYGERSGPVLGGVACLLAVADLTVKTNIRTARRRTLRGATTSSTMQADHRAWFVCKLPGERATYVSNARLDKNAGDPSQRTLLNRIHSD